MLKTIVVSLFLCTCSQLWALSNQDSAQLAQFVHFLSTPVDTTRATVAPMKQMKDARGFYYIDFAYGKGDSSMMGKRHFIRFIGSHKDGIMFDTTFSANKLFSFVMGNKELLQGFELGVQTMRCGGRRRIVIPPTLAYGANGYAAVGIGANETLTFDIELVKVE